MLLWLQLMSNSEQTVSTLRAPFPWLELQAYRFERGLEDRRCLWFQKERLKGTMHYLRVPLVVGKEEGDGILPIFIAIPHPNGTPF